MPLTNLMILRHPRDREADRIADFEYSTTFQAFCVQMGEFVLVKTSKEVAKTTSRPNQFRWDSATASDENAQLEEYFWMLRLASMLDWTLLRLSNSSLSIWHCTSNALTGLAF